MEFPLQIRNKTILVINGIHITKSVGNTNDSLKG